MLIPYRLETESKAVKYKEKAPSRKNTKRDPVDLIFTWSYTTNILGDSNHYRYDSKIAIRGG